MTRVLFVDDDVNLLQALHRRLRGLRDHWQMHFAESAAAALRLLEQQSADAIVSDVRMPGMDGVELLRQVRERFPGVIRIVLSGHCAEGAVLRSVGIAHQYLAKPCDPDALQDTVQRARALRRLLQSEALREAVSRVGSLPSPPSVFQEINAELQNPDASVRRVGAIVARDPALAAKVLQLVNSAFFALPRRVADPITAATMLGVEIIKNLVLSLQVIMQLDAQRMAEFDCERMVQQNLIISRLARSIAQSLSFDRTAVDDTVSAALLHDAGRLVFMQHFPDEYREVLRQIRAGRPSARAERELLGATHSEVGAYLLGLWGLPDLIVEAVAFHHEPAGSGCHKLAPLTALHAAEALALEPPPADICLDTSYLAALELEDRIPAWRELATSVRNLGEAHAPQSAVC